MDDVTRTQAEAWRDDGFTYWESYDFSDDFFAGSLKRDDSGSVMDGTINSATASKARVGGVHDSVHFQGRYVTLHDDKIAGADFPTLHVG